LGRAVHSVLQTIDLTTDDKLEETAAAQAANEGIPERTDDVVKLVRNALNSEAVKRAVASGRYYREVFVSAPIDKCSVDGFIDLLFEEDNQFVIVDYKTDAIEEVPSDSKKDQYLIQAGIYALAVSRITGRPVKDIILLFLKVPKELTFKASGDLISLAEKTIQTSLLTT
jgi:ATP-dependent helicase/nuclease subunit A